MADNHRDDRKEFRRDSDTHERRSRSPERRDHADYIQRDPLDFADFFERLPADAPVNHAHIIHLSSYSSDIEEGVHDVKLWDAVVTMLLMTSEEAVNNFLNSSVSTFQLVQWFKGGNSGGNLVIWRQGGEVMVGYYITEIDLLAFEILVRCRINFDGSWTIQDASYGKDSRDLNDAWAGVFMTERSPREMADEVLKDPADLARLTGEYILLNRCWSVREGAEWKIECQT